MKKLIPAVLLATLSATSNAEMRQTTMKALCGTTDEVISYMAEYGLEPIMGSESSYVFDENGDQVTGTSVIWNNFTDSTGNYAVTLTLREVNTMSCILVVGEDLLIIE